MYTYVSLPSAVNVLAVSLFHTRAMLEMPAECSPCALQDQETEGRELERWRRVKWKTAMGKLRHTILTLGKCCDTLLTLATLEMHTWPPFIHFFNCMRLTLCMRIPTLLGWPWLVRLWTGLWTMDWSMDLKSMDCSMDRCMDWSLDYNGPEYGLGYGLEYGLEFGLEYGMGVWTRL